MATKLLMATLAFCGLMMGQITDGPGITVQTNGAGLLHRPGIAYPAGALRSGVQGTVSVEVKLDANGIVTDAQVLSGPDELRRAVLESVLNWHFARSAGGSMRAVQVNFETQRPGPRTVIVRRTEGSTSAKPAVLGGPPAGIPRHLGGHVKAVGTRGLTPEGSAELLASFPVHKGDEWSAEGMPKLNEAAKAFDQHLRVETAEMEYTPSADLDVNVVVVAPEPAGAVSRVKVGGNVQGAMVLTKVAPSYPEAARAAKISGIVHMSAIIGMDGRIEELTVLGGPDELVQAATDAVSQWVYKPTMLNGSPVQVDTTIDVNFALSK